MANSKKKYAALLRQAKKKPKRVRTVAEKARYVQKQADKMSKTMTKPEKLFKQICKELKIKIESQKIVMGKIFDFYVPSKNTLVEVDGDYWHGFDLTLEEMNGTQRRAAKNDKKKDMIAKGTGHGLFRIWEHELVKDYETAKARVLAELGPIVK